MSKPEIGRITCPICKTAEGMRFTMDKNGDPFGFCNKHCGAQIRVGGKAERVEAFARAYPEMMTAAKATPAPVADKPDPHRSAPPPPAPAVKKKPQSFLSEILEANHK